MKDFLSNKSNKLVIDNNGVAMCKKEKLNYDEG